MTLEWFEYVAKVVRAEVQKPTFPDDPDPVIPVLQRLADKLLGECHNGLPMGTDQCVVCRAYRTERAEKKHEDLAAKVEGLRLKSVADDTKAKADAEFRDKVEKELAKTREAVQALAAARAAALGAKALSDKAYEGAMVELAEVRKHLQSETDYATKLKEGLDSVLERYHAAVDRAKTTVKESE